MSKARDRAGLLLLIGVVALVGGFAAYAIRANGPRLALDSNNCPSAPSGATLAFIDMTDLWPPQERERIMRSLLRHAERMARHERLMLHAITAKPEQAAAPIALPDRPLGFARCKPLDLAAIDPTVHNTRRVEADYKQRFLAPLTAALEHLSAGGSETQSPILEAIEVALWSPHFRVEQTNRTLVIYSDFLQHTAAHSHLAGQLSSACSLLATEVGRRLAARPWTGVRVVLEYVRNPRDADRQRPQHLSLWTELFHRLGAAEVRDGATLVAPPAAACTTVAAVKPRSTRSRKR